MFKKSIRSFESRAGLLCIAGTVAVGLEANVGALAQEVVSQNTNAAPAAASVNTVEEVVVTSTRIKRNGYEAPSPTTVVGAEEIAAAGPSNIANFMNELPSLANSATPATQVGYVSGGTSGINALNLRDLGENRTLVLLDGQRVGPSTLTGWVDINQFPQALVKRVDVVTGGASADWGSDAVAGVVNFVLDKDFTGLKAEATGGLTTYADDGTYNLSLAAGTGFANGRGHVLLSLEDAYDAGIQGVPRSWYNGAKLIINPSYTPTNGQPQLLVSPNTGFATYAPGGIITSGPLKGTYFGPGGTPLQLNYGPVVSGNYMQGGQWQYTDFAKSGDLAPRLDRQNIFLRTSYDVTDGIQVFGQLSYGRADSHEAALDQFKTVTIQPDNAFIPSSVASQVTGPFSLGTLNQDLGPIVAVTQRYSLRAVVGADGGFDAAGTHWTWDAYGQRGENHIYTAADLLVTANYNNAVNAVRNSNGAIVCQSTLTTPNNGCVPFDIFGTGVNNQAALNYILGTAWGRTQITENVVAANLHGDPISAWAGPVSVATGIEHRREAVSGSNDPLSSQNAYFAGNYHASFGSYDVTEGYFETVVPLAKDVFLAKSLDFNGAVRATDYSISGYVTTWKLGPTYSPVEDLTFRATRSRDIRAPDLAELFQASQTSTTVLTDPFHGNTSATAFQVTNGNLGLKPELADTLDLGVILKPRFVPGFAFSADLYDIKIAQAITTLAAQQLVNECYAGYTALCSGITRNSAGTITAVTVQPFNLASQHARGLDLESSYRRDLATIAPFLQGNLSLRMLATHYLKNTVNNGITVPTDNVGTNSQNVTAALSLPRWRYYATLGWDEGPAAATFTARGISDGVYNTSYISCAANCPASTANNMTINDNHLPGALYFDANFTYQLPYKAETSLFLTVNNLANKSPAQVAYGPNIGTAPLSVNPALYDVLGRVYRFGIRVKM